MSRRIVGWLAVALVASVLVWSVDRAWGLGFILGQSKEELKLKYDVVVQDHGTGRVAVVLTLIDAGRLNPLETVQLAIPAKEKNDDGSSYMDLTVSIDMVKDDDGNRVGRVHILRELAERAQIRLHTNTMDGKQEPMTRWLHVIPIADYLKDTPSGLPPAR